MGSEQHTNGAHHQLGGTREAVGFQCVQHLIGVLNQKSFWNRGRVLFLACPSIHHQLRVAIQPAGGAATPSRLLQAIPSSGPVMPRFSICEWCRSRWSRVRGYSSHHERHPSCGGPVGEGRDQGRGYGRGNMRSAQPAVSSLASVSTFLSGQLESRLVSCTQFTAPATFPHCQRSGPRSSTLWGLVCLVATSWRQHNR